MNIEKSLNWNKRIIESPQFFFKKDLVRNLGKLFDNVEYNKT